MNIICLFEHDWIYSKILGYQWTKLNRKVETFSERRCERCGRKEKCISIKINDYYGYDYDWKRIE